MCSNFLTIKSIVAIGIPLTAVCIQALLRYAMDINFNSMGITLSAIGIGQIFPFIIFENFLLSKVFGIKEEANFAGEGKISIIYTMENKGNTNNIKDIRLLSYVFFLINIILFILTIILNLKGEIYLHLLTGAISCLLTWYYTIKY